MDERDWKYIATNLLPEGYDRQENESWQQFVYRVVKTTDDSISVDFPDGATLIISPGQISQCTVCDRYEQFLEEHHTSYLPERTVDCCKDCHQRIHHEHGFREDLEPDHTRTEAKERDWI